MFWTVTGWIIALLSLFVNYMQLRQNKRFKEEQNINSIKNTGTMKDIIQQSHTGRGNNTVRGK